MRNSNKFLTTLIAVLVLAATLCFSASAASKFSDVKASDEKLTEAVSLLSDLGIAKGTSETTFGTNENVTRQQMAAFIYRLMKSGKSLEGGDNLTSFTDLTDPTYYAYVSWANSMGIINGRSETKFDPTGPITLQDSFTMLVRALGYETKDLPLEYPYDHIDLAESNELGLDDGLSSKVNYDTALKRGDVAIILYNAFFAETNIEEVELVERLLAAGTDAETMVMEERTTYPTVAEYYYDVVEGEFTVVATPHYAFNALDSDEVKPLIDDFDVSTLQLVANSNETVVGKTTLKEIYAEFTELNLEGNADDYIMAGFTVYYTLDEDDELDAIVYADGAVSKVTSREAELGKVQVKNNTDYFDSNGSPQTSYPRLDGSLTVGNETVYFFDAPYNYASPSYGNATNPDDLYALRNEKNIKLIEYRIIDEDKGTYGYYEVETPDTDVEVVNVLNQVYTKGVFEIDLFDVDGDGIYNYLRYKPATFGQAVEDDGIDFESVAEHKNNAPVQLLNDDTNPLAVKKVPTIYTHNADITGKGFNDEDFILAYLNTDANEILVFDVATRTQGTLSYINPSTCTIKVNGKEFRLPYGYLIVNAFEADGEKDNDTTPFQNTGSAKTNSFKKLKDSSAFAEDFVIYSFNKLYNNVMFYEPLTSSGAAYDEANILIPLADASGNIYTTMQYDAKLSEQVYYIKAWVNGTTKYIPVDVKDTYPKPDYDRNGYNFGITVVEDDGKEYFAYSEKLCTYEIDSDGIYHIISLFHARDDEGNFDGINNDPTTLVEDDNMEQYGRDLEVANAASPEVATIKKITGNKYRLTDLSGETLLGTDSEQYIEYFTFTSATKVIIKNITKAGTSDEEVEFLVYDIDTFAGTIDEDVRLTNIQYVLQGDPNSKTRADMLVLFAEAEDFEFETKTSSGDWRILKDTYSSTDDNDYYRNYYDLYNPFTGKVDENVPGSDSYSNSSNLESPFNGYAGKFVKLNTKGQVDEDETEYYQFDLTTNDGLAFVTEYSAADSVIDIAPVNDNNDYIMDSSSQTYLYEITDNTVVTVMTLDKNVSFEDAEMVIADIADLEDPSKDILCYNDKYVEPGKNKYSKEYYEFVKVYVHSDDEAADLDEDELPKADFIVIFVHPDYDNEDFLDLN